MANEASSGASRRLSRRTIVAVFAAFCAVLALGYYMVLRTDYVVLYDGVKPADAAAIVAQLDAKGIAHRLRDGGTTILVPSNEVDGVRLAVAGSDIPLKGSVGFELFNKSDMGLTDFAQKINYQRALQGELTRSILMMEGVESARVHLAMPERSLFRANRSVPKAAVEIISKLGSALSEDRVAGIQQLVASAVPELAVADVAVLDGNGRVVSQTVVSATSQAPELEERVAAQNYFSARARAALASVLPGVQFVVHVLAVNSEDAGTVSRSDVDARPDRSSPNTTARTFPLRVTIVSPTPLNAEEQGIARDAVTAAILLDTPLGDTVTFEVGPAMTAAPSSARPRSGESGSAIPAANSGAGSYPIDVGSPWPVFGGGLALLLLAWIWSRRGGLSIAERDAFVDRLKARLAMTDSRDARG